MHRHGCQRIACGVPRQSSTPWTHHHGNPSARTRLFAGRATTRAHPRHAAEVAHRDVVAASRICGSTGHRRTRSQGHNTVLLREPRPRRRINLSVQTRLSIGRATTTAPSVVGRTSHAHLRRVCAYATATPIFITIVAPVRPRPRAPSPCPLGPAHAARPSA